MQKQSKFVIINYKESDKDIIDELIIYLDEKAQAIYDFFEIKPQKKAIINIIPTKAEYDDICKKERKYSDDFVMPKWAIGHCNNGVITYVSINDYDNTSHKFDKKDFEDAFSYYKKTIVHEFVHFVNEQFNSIKDCCYTEKYLVEGIATYLSGQKNNKQIEFDYTIEQLMERDMRKSCYDGWYLITKFFVENYDKDFVLEIFQRRIIRQG